MKHLRLEVEGGNVHPLVGLPTKKDSPSAPPYYEAVDDPRQFVAVIRDMTGIPEHLRSFLIRSFPRIIDKMLDKFERPVAETLAMRHNRPDLVDLVQTLAEQYAQSRAIWIDSHHALEDHNAKLRDKSSQDHLTGLLNARAFVEEFQFFLEHNSTSRWCAVAFLDGAKFGLINKKYGQDAGDAVIMGLAEELKNHLRLHGRGQSDICGRLGGDEFAFVLTDISGPDPVMTAMSIAERCRVAVAQHVWPSEMGLGDLKVRVDVGMACLRLQERSARAPSASSICTNILKRANELMIRAKAEQQSITFIDMFEHAVASGSLAQYRVEPR